MYLYIFIFVHLLLSLHSFRRRPPPPLQVLLPRLWSLSDGPACAWTGVRPELLLLQHAEGLAAHPLLAAQVQAEVASDGRARRPHRRADDCTAGAGLCWSSWPSCAGESQLGGRSVKVHLLDSSSIQIHLSPDISAGLHYTPTVSITSCITLLRF